jgi:uncharacterized cysteine cluster protein YcgN (CxxCxxCC family)
MRLPDGTRMYLLRYCESFDMTTRLCKRYATRHEVLPGQAAPCLTIEQAIEQGQLPDDCAYVQGLKGYKCKVFGA